MLVETNNLITFSDLRVMFDVTTTTIYKWRGDLGMPEIHIGYGKCPAVYYDYEEIVSWANRCGKVVVCDPRELQTAKVA